MDTTEFVSAVSKIDLSPSSLLLITVPTGDIAAHEVANYMSDTIKAVGELLPAHLKDDAYKNNVWYLASDSDGNGTKVEVVSGDENKVLLIRMPCGGLSEQERTEFLSNIKKSLAVPEGFNDILVVPA